MDLQAHMLCFAADPVAADLLFHVCAVRLPAHAAEIRCLLERRSNVARLDPNGVYFHYHGHVYSLLLHANMPGAYHSSCAGPFLFPCIR